MLSLKKPSYDTNQINFHYTNYAVLSKSIYLYMCMGGGMEFHYASRLGIIKALTAGKKQKLQAND